MIRTISVCERNAFVVPPRVVVINATTATEIFPDDTNTRGEIITRYVQNLTGDDLYISFGLSKADGTPQCNNINAFHTVIQDKALFDCFPHRQRVCVYGIAGGKVSTTKIIRNDLSH